MGRWVTILLGLVFSLLLGGCPCGNGYPYGMEGSCRTGAGSAAPDYTGGTSYPSYDWYDPGYRCESVTGESIASDRGQLVAYQTGWYLSGDQCARQRVGSPVYLSGEAVQSSRLGLGLLGYQGGIYSPPLRNGYISAWCVDASPSGMVEAAVFTPADGSPPTLLYYVDSETQGSGSAVRTLGTSDVRYEAIGYHLTMASAYSAASAFLHNGTLTIGTVDTALLCRITQP